jgi:hypothetical protein
MLPENLEGAIFGLSLKIYDRVYLVVAAALIVRAFLVLSGWTGGPGSRPTRWGVSPSGGRPTTQYSP